MTENRLNVLEASSNLACAQLEIPSKMPARYLEGAGSKAEQAPIARARRVQFVFGECVLDTGRRELSRGSEPIAVGPQVFDLLIHLIENRDRVVSKDELFDVIWRGRTVSDSTLTSHVNFARKAIGDTGDEQRLIRTISRKGFRFVGDVRETPSRGAAKSAATETDPVKAEPSEALTLPDQPSVAVLPFLNLSSDPDQDYFADWVVEDIIGALSRMRWLFVIARNSSFTYKGRAVDVKVGRELGVRYVLEGSVRKAGNPVRVPGSSSMRQRARIFGPTVSIAASTTSSICTMNWRRASWVRSLRSSSVRRSRARNTDRPRNSTPTTITCAVWRAFTRGTRRA